ncbi:unnamed protein product [Psylliodes chrysocephalus]|uniref:Uncharacterized protein n=1 Tax=Psylliodes chrysocephalus TaxID=3402493 RepID=A0A9P0GAP3_9CUCU|nr:unnamed protein product [Psylliodes chrysocephala]
MENVNDRRDIYLKTHWASKRNSPEANNLIARPNFKSCSILLQHFVAIHMGRTKICYSKPLYCAGIIKTKNIEHLDTSNYETDNKFNLPVSKPMLGNFKDEYSNQVISLF